MGTIRVKRVDEPAKKRGKKKGKDKGPPRSVGMGKKGKKKKVAKKATAMVKPKRRSDAPLATRTARVERAHERLTHMLNFDNCPQDYESLKFEAKYLAGLSSYSFSVMAQRLTAIRDEELYVEDGYPDFKSFVGTEISLAVSTVYNYMDVYSLYGGLMTESVEEVGYTKLLPALPLLRELEPGAERNRLVRETWKIARTKNRTDARAALAALKARFGAERPAKGGRKKKTLGDEIARFVKVVPAAPTARETTEIRGLIDHLETVLKNI